MLSRKGPSKSKNSNGTISGDRGNQVLTQEASRLFKTQDLGYVRTMRNKTRKEVEELEQKVVGIRGQGRKVVWLDGEEDMRDILEGEKDNDIDDEPGEDREEEKVDVEARTLQKLQEKEAVKLEARLSITRERLKALAEAEEALDLQRAKMAKSPTIGGVNKHGVKYKVRERKR
jgi:U3 small nucleolar RNA-associated protein 11